MAFNWKLTKFINKYPASKCEQREEFQLIQILGLLDIHFNAAVVFVKNSSLLFRLALTIHTLRLPSPKKHFFQNIL